MDNSRSEKKQKANFFPGTLAKEEGRAKMSCTPWCAMNKITISANKFHYKTGGGVIINMSFRAEGIFAPKDKTGKVFCGKLPKKSLNKEEKV